MKKKPFLFFLLLGTCLICVYFLLSQGSSLLTFLKKCWSIILPFALGGAFAFVLNLPMSFLERRVLFWMDKKPVLKKWKRPLAILIVVLLTILFIALMVSLIIPELVRTITIMVRGFPAAVAKLDELLEPLGVNVGEHLSETAVASLSAEITASVDRLVNLLLKGVAFSSAIIGTVYQEILAVFFVIMFTIYFLASKEKLAAQGHRLLAAYLKPEKAARIEYILKLTNSTFASFIGGQLLEALILGALFFLFMTIFRMPYALLISMFIAVTALIPIFGAWLGCVAGALLILGSNPMTALWFVIMFLVLQQLENNLIYPHIVGKAIGLPSLWVLFSILIGEGLMGILGMLLFIPLVSVLFKLLREDTDLRLKGRNAPEKPAET